MIDMIKRREIFSAEASYDYLVYKEIFRKGNIMEKQKILKSVKVFYSALVAPVLNDNSVNLKRMHFEVGNKSHVYYRIKLDVDGKCIIYYRKMLFVRLLQTIIENKTQLKS